jgi:RND family efflux transporter MFP subunit
MKLHRYVSLLLLAALPLGCVQPPKPEEGPPPPAPVKVEKPKKVALAEWTDLLGTTQPLPDQVARVSAPVEGRIVSILRDAEGKSLSEGQEIKAGTVIAQLDTRIISEQVKQADNAVRQAEIEVKRLETLTMTSSTGPSKLVSPIELQRARLTLEDAQSKQKALEEQVKLYTLTSPISGRLGLVQAVPGQTLAIGAPVVEVVNLNEIDVLCYVPPHVAEHLKLDQPARLTLPPDEAAAPQGKIAFIAVQAQTDTGNFAVKVRFSNPKQQLKANALLPVQVQTEPEKERLMIPEAALQEDQDPPGVVIVQDVKEEKKEGKEEKLGKALNLHAKIGIRDRKQRLVEILELEDPEKKVKGEVKDALFVTVGGYGLKNDDDVKIEEEEAKEPK